MSLGTDAYYRPRLPTSDPFQFASGRYSSSGGLKLDMCGPMQTGMMYDSRHRDANFTASSSFLSATASSFDVRCSPTLNDYEYVPSPTYIRPTSAGHSTGDYNIKTPLTTGELTVAYRQGLVHGQSTTVNHVGTSPQTSVQPGFAIYPWMRSMTTGSLFLDVCVKVGIRLWLHEKQNIFANFTFCKYFTTLDTC